jgi:hypothetical protein
MKERTIYESLSIVVDSTKDIITLDKYLESLELNKDQLPIFTSLEQSKWTLNTPPPTVDLIITNIKDLK